MLCKKCGATISDASKFCGVCGSKIEEDVAPIINENETNGEVVSSMNEEIVPNIDNNVNEQITPTINENKIEEENIPIVGENDVSSQVISNVEPNSEQTNLEPEKKEDIMNSLNNIIQDVNVISSNNNVRTIESVGDNNLTNNIDTTNIQSDTNIPVLENNDSNIINNIENSIESTAKNTGMQQQPLDNNVEKNEITSTNNNKKKGNNAILFIILGIVLLAVAGVLFYLSLNKNSNPINVLKKSLANFEDRADDSGTIVISADIKSGEDSMNVSANLKYQEINDEVKFAVTLNKSILFEEMNLYAKVNKQSATLYTTSDVVDMLGSTESKNKMWLYYLIDLKELNIENTDDSMDMDELEDIIDKEHFKYVDSNNGINHYQLVIDNSLIQKINSKVDQKTKEQIEQTLNQSATLDKPYIVDFYINNNNQLEKISIDLTKELQDEQIEKFVISISFSNFGSTIVDIPNEAVSSNMDLMSYMQKYVKIEENNFNNNTNINANDDFAF